MVTSLTDDHKYLDVNGTTSVFRIISGPHLC